MQPQPTTNLAKGLNFRTFLRTLERIRGKTAVDTTVGHLPEEAHDALYYGKVVASGWYPAAWYRELHAAAQRVCCTGPDLARTIGRENTIEDFKGVYRTVVALFSPETVFHQSTRLFRMYWQGGTAKTLNVTKGIGRVRFDGWVDFDQNVWEDIIGSVEGILDVCGATQVRCRRVYGGGDDGSLELEVRWK